MIERIYGHVAFQSNMDIEDVGREISDKLFSGLKFIGKEDNIYEEVPAIYIENNIIGLKIILSGYQGFCEEAKYILEVYTCYSLRSIYHVCDKTEFNKVKINNYLAAIMKTYFRHDDRFRLDIKYN